MCRLQLMRKLGLASFILVHRVAIKAPAPPQEQWGEGASCFDTHWPQLHLDIAPDSELSLWRRSDFEQATVPAGQPETYSACFSRQHQVAIVQLNIPEYTANRERYLMEREIHVLTKFLDHLERNIDEEQWEELASDFFAEGMDAPRLTPPLHDGILEQMEPSPKKPDLPSSSTVAAVIPELILVNLAMAAGCLPVLFLQPSSFLVFPDFPEQLNMRTAESEHKTWDNGSTKDPSGCAGRAIEFFGIHFTPLVAFGFFFGPPGDDFWHEMRETAESETPTLDPCITPSEAGDRPGKLSRRQRRAKKQAAEQSDKAMTEGEGISLDSVKQLRKILRGTKSDGEEASWSSLKGPERGVRWRGGTPPAPPKWQYSKDDLRAFSKFERKVGIWQLQVKPYMSEAEAALTLYCSLSGEAEEELEHIAKQVYLKRKFLADFETVSRFNGEGMRSYVNRYHRAEKALLSIGINVTLTYDSESRGSRLLDRAKLTLEQQRMVLVGTNQSLHFDEVKNALVLQYPDHKPPPFVQGHPGGKDLNQRPPKGKGKGNKGASSSTSAPSGSSFSSPSTGSMRREDDQANLEDDHLEVIPEDDDGEEDANDNQDGAEDEGEELIPDMGDDTESTIQELMQVLTVTSKKLQSMTQGRKYRGAPRKSVEERKRTSACSACGQIGHWTGDPECPISAKGKTKGDAGKGGKGNTTSVNDKRGGTSAQKVFSVRHAGGHEVLYAFDHQQHLPQGQDDCDLEVHRSLVVFQSAEFDCMTIASEMQGYCVVDTACQRTCCSRAWCDSQQALLQSFGLEALFSNRREAFKFGAGAPQISTTCMYFPVAFEANHPLIALGTSVLDGLDIPFLASLRLLKKLNVILDLAKQKAYIGLLDCTVDLFLVQGHLCLKNSEYPADVAFDWEQMDVHDYEFLCDSRKCTVNSPCETAAPQAQESTLIAVQDARRSSEMARELAARHERHQADDGAGDVNHPPSNEDRPGEASSGKPRRWSGKGAIKQEQAQAGASESADHLPTYSYEAPRQCPGPLHDMRGLPMQVEMGRRRRWCHPWMALSSIIQVACAALAFGGDGPGSLVDARNGFLFDGAGGFRQDATSANFGDFSLRVPWDAGHGDRGDRGQRQRPGGLRLGPGDGSLIRGSGPAPLRKGQWKRAVHNFDKTLQLLGKEVEVYNQWPGDLHLNHRADLLEVFWENNAAAGRFKHSLASKAETYALSLVNLQGLELDKSPELLLQILSQVRPRVLYVHSAARQPAQVKIAIQKCCELQVIQSGRFIVDFNPDLHDDVTGVLLQILELPETGKASPFKQKHVRNEAGNSSFVTNCRCLLQVQGERECNMADFLLQCIHNEVRMMCPWKFDESPHDVWYAPPVDAPEEWMSFLESLEKRLGRSRYFYLSEDSKEMRQLKQLVPWELTRAQVYAQPVTRRMPADVPFSHRGAAMILNNGQLLVESEDLNEVRQPRLRFETPVRIAVFFYGMAEDDKSQQPVTSDNPDVHVPGLRTDVSFPGLPETIPKEVRSAVARLHCNAGHPPRQELVRLLAAHGTINAAVLTALEHLKCGTCERARGPLKPRPASVPEFVGQFAEQLQADLFYVRDLSSTNHALLGVTCLATKLYQAAILTSREPQLVLNEFDRLWLRPYGYPLFMTVDADGAFEGAFQQHLQESGVLLNTVPADGHHQIGAIERRNAIFRSVLERLIDQNGVTNRDQLDLCISAAVWAVNSSIHTRGRSSMQAVFGKLPRLPGDLLSDSAALATSDYHLLTEQLRSQACQAVSEMSASAVIRRALLRKTATSRARVNELLPGSMVAYWRWNLKARGRKRGGYILGRLVVKDDKNAWVQSGGSLVQVTHEIQASYCEMVFGMMLAKPDHLLMNPLSLLSKRFPTNFQNHKLLNKTSRDNTNYLLELLDHNRRDQEAKHAPGQEAELLPCLQLHDNINFNRRRQANLLHHDSPQLHGDVKQSNDYELQLQKTNLQRKCQHLLHHQPPNLNDDHLPQALKKDLFPNFPPKDLTKHSLLSMQERKAIDREIPWRKIISDFPSNVIDLYVQANKKEFASWTSWGSIRPVPGDEAQRIRADPRMRRRIMPSRNAYRDKNRGAGPEIKAKCRTVIQGCHDPDLGLLDRSSPTPTRLAELLIYEIACSGYNRRLQRNKKSWKLWCGDVSTAFLQGQPQARTMPIYMRPPRDDIQKMAQTFLHDLYEIVGNLYGLCNAPRTWINHIVSKLLEANFKRHRLDHTVYYKLDDVGDLLVILLFHVDDFLVAYREDYAFDELSGMFTWGQTNLLDDGEFVFKGKEVKLICEKGEFKIKVTQKAFINELTPGKLQRGRLDQAGHLTSEEFKEYRSCAGSLQWLGGSTRPDICASVSLSNLGQDNGPQQLKVLYECIDYMKTTPEDGLTFQGVSLNYATHVIGYGDSSWANAPGGKSQMGVIVLLAGPECKDKVARATIVDWRSSRSPRVTRSTLASEANAMDECVDRCTFCNCFLSELLGGHKVTPEQLKTKGMLQQLQITDCKSLCDSVIADNPATSEKRTTISIRSIQDYISPEQVHWVPTTLMHADVLTKHSVALRDSFIKWLRNPTVQLVELSESLVHRKENFPSVKDQL
ncbi:GIP [Symbiodinium sp. CCMP2592]|nr:GIP [Symbiodinium sp. CCMP2592]